MVSVAISKNEIYLSEWHLPSRIFLNRLESRWVAIESTEGQDV